MGWLKSTFHPTAFNAPVTIRQSGPHPQLLCFSNQLIPTDVVYVLNAFSTPLIPLLNLTITVHRACKGSSTVK